MAQTKDFSILKWLVFPSLTLALGATVAYFNVRVFGWDDGLPYVVIVAVLVAFSIAINRYISSENTALARAAFVLEIVLILALAINAAYSFSVQRNMSIARQSETARSEDLKTISTLKSRTAQRDATRMIASKTDDTKSAQAIFAENERPLFWIMVAELLAYIISAFTLLGISHLWTPKTETSQRPQGEPVQVNYRGERGYVYLPDGRKRVTESTYSPDEVGMIVDADYEFPSDLETKTQRRKTERADLTPAIRNDIGFLVEKKETAKKHASFDSEGLKRLREALKDISFRLPGLSFKSYVRGDAVWILMMAANRGTQETVASAKAQLSILNDALTMQPDAFRARLERFLRQNEFAI